ncbi:hypothetical protein K505DRAFT_326474 [Melanomma pulvis-pyrius CBS 109.77]|uniref:Zn(2)-C6 fungal-type domain-containing protein n=1 Tax=Melanomma pulvis-pyrius CBS 109.77 TaxID=1314802 RepID=A0A6A6X7U8_9PLEO|nr:hypothetical protein K505DRAFT_326474 [Melanomma pulvis-pyrius CBS 109.77]
MDPTAHVQNNFLAFRSSCDRCRYMKLKCPSNGNDTNEPCERCSKAKLRCTYSRRTSLRKRTAAGQDNGLDAPDGRDEHMAAPDITITDQGSGQSDESSTSIGVIVSEIPSEPVDAFCFSNTLDVLSSDELLWTTRWDDPSTSTMSPALWPNHTPAFSEHEVTLSAQCTLNLATLAVELGKCLQMLRDDIRTQQSIDNYPIGHIRHLSQAFVASAQSPSALDVLTSLLLLSCYVTLRKLYINAFFKIKDHILLGNDNQQQISHDPRTTRLRGMDMLNERCIRSYTAFNITIDLLHNCDAALGLCTVCRPPGQSGSPTSMTSAVPHSQGVPPGDNLEAPMEQSSSSSACIACALPANFRMEAVSIFNAIADQEHALHEVIAMLRGTLRHQMGLL